MLATAMALVIWSADTGFAKTTFTLADLAGEWNFHGLVSGYPDDFQTWVYGTMTCDDMGGFAQQATNKTGETNQVKGVFEISPDGIITIPAGSGHGSSFRGVMRNNKDTMVLTGNDGGGGCFLAIYTRSDDRLVTSDLQGRYVHHGLISGNEVGPAAGWWYGSVTIDSNGNAVFDSPFVSSGGEGEIPRPLKFSMGKGAIVTEQYDPAPFHGALNQSKDMMVSVATVIVGYNENVHVDIPGDILFVWEKYVPGSYTMRDLAGTWYVHGLTSSSSYNDWIGWGHFTLLVDNQGQGNMVTGSYLNNLGETDHTWSGSMTITSDGIVTGIGASCHGIMNLGKDMWVGTMNDGGGGYGLVFAVGRSPLDEFDFNADGRVDFLDLAIFASHWLN